MSQTKSPRIFSQLGYFLTETYWINAGRLLDFQLSVKAGKKPGKENKHFNTLSMFYYERLPKKYKERVQNAD